MMTIENREVELTLGGQTRTVTVTRMSPKHCWYAQCVILVRCRTGTKLHREPHPLVAHTTDDRWVFVPGVLRNHRTYPHAWADDLPGSGWR